MEDQFFDAFETRGKHLSSLFSSPLMPASKSTTDRRSISLRKSWERGEEASLNERAISFACFFVPLILEELLLSSIRFISRNYLNSTEKKRERKADPTKMLVIWYVVSFRQKNTDRPDERLNSLAAVVVPL